MAKSKKRECNYLTPPELAKQLGVDAERVIAWIRRGDLQAMNFAISPHGRPRFHISLDAVEEFKQRRTVRPPPKVVRRKAKSRVTEYV